MTKSIRVAAMQLAFTDDMNRDVAAVAALVEDAAQQGANIILPPELFLIFAKIMTLK
jgi:N-carbamoylputrescine amidase